ncbi:hypothetical protein EJ04DRAFT_31729 [Polyplosphaeria fusca]|uniref:Uncharacterized protein n=1 Tax=Polyplosphaeria fusca TaxID=682080 RepID=A0A9P4V005_9PLEO|nr:hypothetical protein EJ04DRAFT_31729 [Polyplosphaeria fusca]
MRYTASLLTAVAVLPATNAIAFGGPAPTNTSPQRELDGWTPKPTNGPTVAELRKRQTNYYPEVCGWVDGIFESAVSCQEGQTCMLYTTVESGTTGGMAGCCTAGDTQNCGWAYSCIDRDNYSANCDSSCSADDFVRKCTSAAMPYCVTWAYASDSVYDYGCGSDAQDTFQTIWQEATDTESTYTTSMSLPTVSNNAVSFADMATESSSAVSTSTEAPAATSSAPAEEKKKSNAPLIGGIVGGVGGVALLIAGGVIFFCMKKNKDKKKAALANQANNQPALSSQQPPQMQQAPTPGPEQGYFGQDQKINHEYGMQSPVSNPSTPAPPYAQPYYANSPVVPPMPMQSPQPYQVPGPANGAHQLDSQPYQPSGPANGAVQLDSISVTPAKAAGAGPAVYEMDSGK